MKNSNSTSIKFGKRIYGFLKMVLLITLEMAILYPVLMVLLSVIMQFTPHDHETAIAMRTMRAIILFIESGAIIGFSIGCAMGFVLHIFPAFFAHKKTNSYGDTDEITR